MAFKHVRFSALLSALIAVLAIHSPTLAQAAPPTAALLNSASVRGLNASVPNFGVVSPTLLRGGQPRDGGLAALKNAGVKTIVNLRDGEDDIAEEAEVARSLGLKYVSIPLSVFGSVSNDEINQFLSVTNSQNNQPVFVHCRQGQDRTGTMVAMYRMKEQGWTADKAYQEMKDYGFHPFFLGLKSAVFRNGKESGLASQNVAPEQEILADIKTRVKKFLGNP